MYYATPVEVLIVYAIEALDIGIAILLNVCPVVAVALNGKTEVACMLYLLRVMTGVPHDLFRHTANIDAGSAQWRELDHCGFRTILRCALRVSQAAAAAANYNKVKFYRHTCYSIMQNCVFCIASCRATAGPCDTILPLAINGLKTCQTHF